jgi:hypothetical protein
VKRKYARIRRPPGSVRAFRHASKRLLVDVPLLILDSYPLPTRGLTDGLSLAAAHWRGQLERGELRAVDMQASIVPTVTLASAMIEALLRSVAIGQRPQVLAELADASAGVLSGDLHRLVIRSGITAGPGQTVGAKSTRRSIGRALAAPLQRGG